MVHRNEHGRGIEGGGVNVSMVLLGMNVTLNVQDTIARRTAAIRQKNRELTQRGRYGRREVDGWW